MANEKKLGYQVARVYENKAGHLERKNRSCPKCGQGFFMAKHATRWTCGKCHYTEFLSASQSNKN